MLPADVYELTAVADPRLSPDGRSVAYVVRRVERDENAYASAIWLRPLDGSGTPRQLTEGRRLDASPRWSPDGRRLAFVSNRDGNCSQLYVVAVAGGEPERLTDLDESVGDVAWSPAGDRLAFTARVRSVAYSEEDESRRRPRRTTRLQFKADDVGWTADRRRHVFTVDAGGAAPPRQLTHGDFEDSSPAWSPDGERIVFVSAREPDWDISPASDLYLVAASGGEPRRLTGADASCASPAWSPDGTRVAFHHTAGLLDFPHHGQIALVSPDGGEQRLLTAALDRNCSPYPSIREPIWLGDEVVFAVEDGGNVHLYAVAAGGGSPPRLLVGGELAITGYDVAGESVLHTARTPVSPPELYAGERALTDVGAAFCAAREIVAPERFSAVSADGREVEAWLVRPAGFEPGRSYPLLLSVHGGPFTQYGSSFFDEFQVYAGAGYAVAFANPRGSSGYGEEWGRAIRGPVAGGPGWGSLDHDDLMAVVDTALERFPFCDRERLGVLGGSYGGYMTTWLVGHSDRFAAACSERALNQFVSHFGSSDIGWAMGGYTGGFAFEHPQAHLERSPATYAADIRTPLLILHAENDLRCPVEQAEQLFTILRLLRRDVELVRFPAESHELSRSGSPVHRVQRFEVLLDWFERKLGRQAT